MTCTYCQAPLTDGARFCSICGRSASASDSTTMLADAATQLAAEPSRPPSSGSGAQRATPISQTGWLSSSGALDHGRFAPGMVLENRYRVLGLLGRGGMGEVYRADDLRLGQSVALKFLPPELSRDAARLAQLHNEVRTARHVSHPNVCRVYDIGEMDGQLFITMEYVDGEDLSVLLRRIGRLPEDKALEIARQICAGLGAAHDRGVLHRDLKPANIMLDGVGKVRIMDFSLAAVGNVTDIRAGTPAYMSPEQIAGQEVTARSDIYALGLVLYEIFTGRRAFDAKTLAELVAQHQAGAFTPPAAFVKTLDPAIETAIVRCLDPQPERRPSSAIRVSASLPGGDPLAAAIAAGETPSPEMVAAAGGDRAAIGAAWGAIWLGLAVGAVVVLALMLGRSALLARVPLQKPAPVLQDRADQMREAFGYVAPPADRASGFTYDNAFLQWVPNNRPVPGRWSILREGRPAAVRFWYRTSPRPIVPFNQNGTTSLTDPPLDLNGMTLVMLDTAGRLQRFEAAPPQVEAPLTTAPPPVDWDTLFAAAGLERAAFAETAPSRTPPSFADERRAWAGVVPGTDIPVTIDAAAYRGRPTLFDIVPPWRQPAREPGPAGASGNNPLYIYLLLVGATVAAWANVRRGRADSRGALRLAAFTFVLLGSSNWVVSPHVADLYADQQRLFSGLGLALFVAGVLYLLYLGLEPFVRRSWPTMLIGWSRLLGGRVRDPVVGRDVLVGIGCGALLAAASLASEVLPARFGLPEPLPHTNNLGPLMGLRPLVATVVGSVNTALQNALINVFQFALFRAFFEWAIRGGLGWLARRWAWAGRLSMSDATSERAFFVSAVAAVLLLFVANNGSSPSRLLDGGQQALMTIVTLLLLLRVGIFAATMMFFSFYLLLRVPLTFDSSALYASASWLTVTGVVGLAAAGWWIARTDSPEA